MIGRMLSQFKIIAKLGEGGMGEVYRAEDTKLGREVAIKVLPEELTADSERMARFEREAQVLASLNHPSIATIHDLLEVEGTHFLVLELVEGEDLATMLERGPVALPAALHIALQLAEALDAAHSRDIVHRDFKPGNIMVGPTDLIKVLDFGLAKAAPMGGAEIDTTHSPTRTAPMTEAGVIMGTAAYMSPEQARGQEVDKQADIWAFGVVLWEMLTGKPLFDGENIADIFVAVLKADIDWDELPESTPAGIRRLLDRCLRREARQRLHDIGDARIEVEAAMEGEESDVGLPAAVSERRVWPSIVATATIVAVLAAVWIFFGPGPAGEPGEVFRSNLIAPEGLEFGLIAWGNVKLSPTGDRLAFHTAPDPHLVVHDFATGEFKVFEDLDATFPFWSPDGRWIAFFSINDKKLKKIPADGGPVQILADAPNGRGGTWSPNGTIVFAPDTATPLVMVSDSGGTPRPVTTLPGQDVGHTSPHFLPDGEHFLFCDRTANSGSRITVGSINGGAQVPITDWGSNPQWAAGHLFFVRDRNLLAQPFDPSRLTTQGPVRPIAELIDYYGGRAIGNFSVSGTDLLAYRQSPPRRTQVAWYGRDGRELATVGEPAILTDIRINDDESRAVLVRRDETATHGDIWVMDLERGQMTRATFASSPTPIWAVPSSTGERLAVMSYIGDRTGLWLQSATGAGPVDDVLGVSTFYPSDWSGDGRYLLGEVQELDTGHDVIYIDLEEDREIRPLLQSKFDELHPDLSPDAKWLAYLSTETGRNELYVTDFPLAREKWLVSREGELDNFTSRWSRDGLSLYYQDAEGIFEVTFEDGDPPAIGLPRLFLANDQLSDDVYRPFAVVGERIFALKYVTKPTIEPVRLIRNWQRLLED